jgi:hypothetical protein
MNKFAYLLLLASSQIQHALGGGIPIEQTGRAKIVTVRHAKMHLGLRGEDDRTENAKVVYCCSTQTGVCVTPGDGEVTSITAYFTNIDIEVLKGGKYICPVAAKDGTSKLVDKSEDCKDEVAKLENKGALTCEITQSVEFRSSDAYDDEKSELKSMDKFDLKCMDGTVVNIHFKYGQRGNFAGSETCFVSKLNKKEEDFEPFEYRSDPIILLSPCTNDFQCIEQSMQFSFMIDDDEKLNKDIAKLSWPMISLGLVVDVEFAEINELDMYWTDVVAVNFYKNSPDNVRAW